MLNRLGSLNRRLFLERLGGSAIGAVLASGIAGAESGKAAATNILFINADDVGMGDLSCYGSKILTPNIDSIGAQGVRFSDFYVSSPVCTPSRFSQLTGLWPGRSRHKLMGPLTHYGGGEKKRGIEIGETTIAEILKELGYATGLVGKWHLGHGNKRFLPTRHGFDYFYGFTTLGIDYFTHLFRGDPCFYRNEEMIQEQGYSTDLFTREAVSFLERNRGNPFYLNLAYNAPHYAPKIGPTSVKSKDRGVLQAPRELVKKFSGPDTNRNVYSAMVLSMDNGVGEVLAALASLGLADSTLVIFTSDNGADPEYGGSNSPYRGGKSWLFEGGIRIPCLMRWPAVIPAGVVSSQVGSHLDFFPTFAALAGADVEARNLDGMDISGTLRTPQAPSTRRTLYWKNGQSRAVRDGRWKYLEDYRSGRIGRLYGGEGVHYLFDLEEDPFEKENLYKEKNRLAAQLLEKLDHFMAST